MRNDLTQAITEAQSNPTVLELLERTAHEPDCDGFPLAPLTAVHLLTFAGTDQALLDVPVLQSWTKLNRMQRWQLRRLGMESFRNTKLVTQSSDQKITVHPFGALIMGARINPRFILTLGYRVSARGLRVFAIESGAESAECYILEQPDFSLKDKDATEENPLNWSYRYSLLPRPFLAALLAKFVFTPVDEDSVHAAEPSILSLYHPPVTDQNMVTGLEFHGSGPMIHVLRSGPGLPTTDEGTGMTPEELTVLMSDLLAT